MIGAVENAMLERMEAAGASGVLGYSYRTRKTWPREFDKWLEGEVVGYPACWSTFGGIHKSERMGRGQWKLHCTFGLIVAAENKRQDESYRRHGAAGDPGSYQLAMDAIAVLGDQELGLGINGLEPLSVEPVDLADLGKLKLVSMYAVTFATVLVVDTFPFKDKVFPFDRLHVNWDPAPYGHIDRSKPLPQDAAVIASDSTNLPQDGQ